MDEEIRCDNYSDNCSDWIEGVGDCGKNSCNFCRIEKCINNLENIYGQEYGSKFRRI